MAYFYIFLISIFLALIIVNWNRIYLFIQYEIYLGYEIRDYYKSLSILGEFESKVNLLMAFYKAYDESTCESHKLLAVKVYSDYTFKSWIDDYHKFGKKYSKEWLMEEAKKELGISGLNSEKDIRKRFKEIINETKKH